MMLKVDTTRHSTHRYISSLVVIVLLGLIISSMCITTNRPAKTASYKPSLVFGTNLSLYDSKDQLYANLAARTTLQQNHIQIVRLPLRSDSQLVANTVKQL